MPVYCYSFGDDVRETFSASPEPKPFIVIDGKTYERDFQAEHGRPKPAVYGQWPITSVSMAIQPEQIAEFEAAGNQAGIPTKYTPDGRPILDDRQHRSRYADWRGFVDRDAYDQKRK